MEIEIDLSPLRPHNDVAAQPMVAGDIHYPNGDEGVLLLFKPTLVGDEPVDVRQYHARNDAFPHESTGDQFHDEAQWEAYRRLGMHAARSAFWSVMKTVDEHEIDGTAAIFGYARRQWLAAPEGLAERLPTLTSRAAELDLRLLKRPSSAMAEDVYGEIAAPRAEQPRTLSAGELVDTLDLVREALLFMEETFVCEKLDLRDKHPMYLGLVNYFSRWTHSTHVRAWWPVLRPLHAQRFARYLEVQLGLGANITGGVLANARLSAATSTLEMPTALAASAWAGEQRDAPALGHANGRKMLSLVIPLMPESNTPCEIQVAQVRLDEADELLSWDADDFYVAPSLWGSGIGETFLERLTHGAATHGATQLLVSTRSTKGRGRGARKEGVDVTQMYRAAGFQEVWALGDGRWTNGEEEFWLGVTEEADSRRLWRRTAS